MSLLKYAFARVLLSGGVGFLPSPFVSLASNVCSQGLYFILKNGELAGLVTDRLETVQARGAKALMTRVDEPREALF